MAKAIMIQGTTSNAGKSLLAAGLCRIFRQDGYRVAPFKSQNMALNSFVTADGLEMGRAQVMQAECAGIPPDVRMNPILLKPNSDTGSQVIVNGEVVGNMAAVEYFSYKKQLIPQILHAYESLASEHDIIVLEGAGSPAEINLKQQDIVNMGMARMAGAPVLLVGDINPGGVFASLAGTVHLLDLDERDMLKGIIINKFRGDRLILEPGLEQLEKIIHKPVLGVVPYLEIDVDDEDSLSERLDRRHLEAAAIDIAVIRLPRMSNFTDFTALGAVPGVQVRYIGAAGEWGNPDLLILPGTKNTMGDLHWLRQSGMEHKIIEYAACNRPIFGICGGYQMLGTALYDPLSVEHGGSMAGLGLLGIETTFTAEKYRRQVAGKFEQVGGIFAGLSGKAFTGYEIHMGESAADVKQSNFCCITSASKAYNDGISSGNIYGCYIHGIFDCAGIAETIIRALMKEKGLNSSDIHALDAQAYKELQYNKLADALRESLDLETIYRIIAAGI